MQVLLDPASGRPQRHRHHSSHRRLIDRDASPGEAVDVDAVVVPATRPAERLTPALRLAARLQCPILALCSQQADAAETREKARLIGADVTAVDLPQASRLPGLRTSALLAEGPFARDSDTSLKRNIGLAVTRMTGWQRILFLDDDISGVRREAVRRAASLLPAYGAVGLRNLGYPDNSVVCHANRDLGHRQDTFVGAGALLVPHRQVTSFFPDVYNEDWFFLLGDERLVEVAEHGTFAQDEFDPYLDPRRAAREEFGDCLAEGLFSLLDDGLTIADADEAFWRAFIGERRKLIEGIRERVMRARISPERQEQVTASLEAALASLGKVTPQLCVTYLDAWRVDRDRWREFVEELPGGLSARAALTALDLKV